MKGKKGAGFGLAALIAGVFVWLSIRRKRKGFCGF